MFSKMFPVRIVEIRDTVLTSSANSTVTDRCMGKMTIKLPKSPPGFSSEHTLS